jgi:hypothetical protein
MRLFRKGRDSIRTLKSDLKLLSFQRKLNQGKASTNEAFVWLEKMLVEAQKKQDR